MTPLFEELGDALAPGKAALGALRRELESRRDRWTASGCYHYRGAGDLILQHGQFWNGRELPEQYAHLVGEPSCCFANAVHAVEQEPSLRYVEGFYSTGGGHYTTHGWCVDPDGEPVEVTFPTRNVERYHDPRTLLPYQPPQHWAYAGVILDIDLVKHHDKRWGLPMLDRSPVDAEVAGDVMDMTELHDWPILKLPFDPNRKELP